MVLLPPFTYVMKTPTVIWITISIILVLLGIYWGLHQTPYTPVTSVDQTTNIGGRTAVLALATSTTTGNYLTAPENGNTLYVYTKDSIGVSSCTGTCAVLWPPYTISTSSSLIAVPGITGTISTYQRNDGTLQLTYNGMPLYFYSKDIVSGDTKGDRVNGFRVATP